jgi:hypothetical protein
MVLIKYNSELISRRKELHFLVDSTKRWIILNSSEKSSQRISLFLTAVFYLALSFISTFYFTAILHCNSRIDISLQRDETWTIIISWFSDNSCLNSQFTINIHILNKVQKSYYFLIMQLFLHLYYR